MSLPYLVEPLLGTLRDDVAMGLAKGALQRWGGVIRIAKGYEGAGRIVSHLRDVATIGVQVPSPLSAVDVVSRVAANVQLHQISSKLSEVMQLTQVSAAAGVLNLGVSAIGFLVINHKLNNLLDSVGRMATVLRDMRADTNRRLDAISEQFVELRYIATVNLALAEEAVSNLEYLRTEFFNRELAVVMSWADRLNHSTQPDDRLLDEAIHSLDQVRLSLQASLGSRAFGAGSEPLWADELMRYRLWCATSAAEVMLIRRAERTPHALRLAQQVAEKSRHLAQTWQKALMPSDELGGVFRLGHSRFEREAPVPLETRRRLARLQVDGGMSDAQLHVASVNAATEVAHAAPSLPESWFARQRSAASVLDFAEEATERLESIEAEMEFCERRRIGFEQWEGLSIPESDDGLAIIRLDRKAA